MFSTHVCQFLRSVACAKSRHFFVFRSAVGNSPLFGTNLHFRHFMLPKRRFRKDEQKMKSGFSTDFSMVRIPNRVLTPLKSTSKIRISSFVHPCEIFVWEVYILCSPNEDLEGGTKDEIQIFEALFKGVSTRFGLRTIEKSVENLDFIFCQTFQNLRLGSIHLPQNFNLN